MLNILIESLIIECLENRINLDKEIDYLYKTLNKPYLTDLQKEIINNNTGIQEFKLKTHKLMNSEDFKEELQDLGIEL